MGKLALFARHHLARQIDKRGLKSQRRYIDADGIATIRIYAEIGGGIAAAFGCVPHAGNNKSLLFQFADDIGNGLHGESHAPCNIATRDWSVLANGLKHDPAVIRSPKLLVRSL